MKMIAVVRVSVGEEAGPRDGFVLEHDRLRLCRNGVGQVGTGKTVSTGREELRDELHAPTAFDR